MVASNSKRLIILDLDHTLIYSTSHHLKKSKILFKYSANLIVHERPFARELVDLSQKHGDIIVFTTAVYDYAKEVCNYLSVSFKELRSRKDCAISSEGNYEKIIDEDWFNNYSDIIIIDDSPEIWDPVAREKCKFLVPEKYTGSVNDIDLKRIISAFSEIISG